jgi:hypothetical protein
LDEAEQEFYESNAEAQTGIGVSEYADNYWRANAVDWDPDDD